MPIAPFEGVSYLLNMVPKAKKNLHECEYHLNNLLRSRHFEEVEINFAAFVNSARNTTFVLQKEFKEDPEFIEWYGNPDKPEEAAENTKLYEMKNDELCTFFKNLRSQIIKEGINNLHCSTGIKSLNSSTDFPDKPVGATIIFTSKGIYYHIHQGTEQEDYMPVVSKTAQIVTSIYIADAPARHLNQTIPDPNLLQISNLYFAYLKNLVNEWTGKINSRGSM